MTHRDAALVLLACAVGTYAFRGGLMLLFSERVFPPPVERALGNVGPAVLAALTVNLLVSSGAGNDVSVVGNEVVALGIACAVAWWRKSLVWTLVAGMVALWLLEAVHG